MKSNVLKLKTLTLALGLVAATSANAFWGELNLSGEEDVVAAAKNDKELSDSIKDYLEFNPGRGYSHALVGELATVYTLPEDKAAWLSEKIEDYIDQLKSGDTLIFENQYTVTYGDFINALRDVRHDKGPAKEMILQRLHEEIHWSVNQVVGKEWDDVEVSVSGNYLYKNDDLYKMSRPDMVSGLDSHEVMAMNRMPSGPDGFPIQVCRFVNDSQATYYEIKVSDIIRVAQLTSTDPTESVVCLDEKSLMEMKYPSTRMKSFVGPLGHWEK